MKKSKRVFLTIFDCDPTFIEPLYYADACLYNDPELIRRQFSLGVISYGTDEVRAALLADRAVVLEAIRAPSGRGGTLLSDEALAPLRDDKEIVIAAIQRTASAFQSASDRLKEDEGVLLAALKGNDNWGTNCYYVPTDEQGKFKSDLIRNNINFFRAITVEADCWYPILYAGPEVCANKEIMMFACSRNSPSLELASDALKMDIDLLWAALKVIAITPSPPSYEYFSFRHPSVYFSLCLCVL